MKSLTAILGVFTLVFFSGCEDGDDPSVEIVLLNIAVDSNYYTNELWIVTHTETGVQLEHQQLQTGDEAIVKTRKSLGANTFSFTILNQLINGDNKSYLITTYQGIEPGISIRLKGVGAGSSATPTGGQVNVVVENFPSVHDYLISDRTGSLSMSSTLEYANNKLTVNTDIWSDKNDFFFQMTDGLGNPKYKLIEDVDPAGEVFSYDYSELSDFDQVVEFTFPFTDNYALFVDGSTENSGEQRRFITNAHYGAGHPHTSWKAGYLNGFNTQGTSMYLSYNGYSLFYIHGGTAPNGNIQWPTANAFAVNNEALNNYSATVPSNFRYRSSSWSYYSVTDMVSVSWQVWSPSSSQKIGVLPADILTRYPMMKVDELKYANTSFYVGEGTRTYKDRLSEIFSADADFSGTDLGITLN